MKTKPSVIAFPPSTPPKASVKFFEQMNRREQRQKRARANAFAATRRYFELQHKANVATRKAEAAREAVIASALRVLETLIS